MRVTRPFRGHGAAVLPVSAGGSSRTAGFAPFARISQIMSVAAAPMASAGTAMLSASPGTDRATSSGHSATTAARRRDA